jgi:hypothetical protein
VFRDQLHFHHTAEDTAIWPPVRAKLTGDPAGLALMDAMQDEHKLINPLLAAIDDTLATGADGNRLRSLLSQLRATLASHLAHEEAGALPLISKVMSPAELTAIRKAIAKMSGLKRCRHVPVGTIDRPALTCARRSSGSCLPRPRLLYRARWLPRYRRNTPTL